jgi:hypothetical protein
MVAPLKVTAGSQGKSTSAWAGAIFELGDIRGEKLAPDSPAVHMANLLFISEQVDQGF